MFDIEAIRGRHTTMQGHFDAQDEGEFSIAATEALDDVPALLAEIERLTADAATPDKPTSAATADVLIGWVHPGKVDSVFTDALLHTIAYDRASGGERIAGWNGVQCSANISAGRNKLVEGFLESSAQWLVMIDTDMVWTADAVHQLLEVADPDTAPIVGGLCFGQEPDTGLVFPTMYDLTEVDGQAEFVRYDVWAPESLFAVLGTGAAFLLVHRTVFEAVRDKGFSVAFPWFQETELEGKRVGEDVTFCMRASLVDKPTHVHTGVHIGHVKSHLVTTQAYFAQRMMLAQQERAAADAPFGEITEVEQP